MHQGGQLKILKLSVINSLLEQCETIHKRLGTKVYELKVQMIEDLS